MRMVDLIEYKKNNGEFNHQQIRFIIDGYVEGSIPDYQMSALLMAICFQGLTLKETALLTKVMEESGDIIDLSKIEAEKNLKTTPGSDCALNALAIDEPLEYAKLYLDGNLQM